MKSVDVVLCIFRSGLPEPVMICDDVAARAKMSDA